MDTTSTTAETITSASPLFTITTRHQFTSRLGWLGLKLRRIASRKARLQATVDRKQASLDKLKTQLGKLSEEDRRVAGRHALSIYDYARRELNFDPTQPLARERVLDAPTGRCRLYSATKGKLVFVTDEETTARELLEKFPELFWELCRVSVRKDTLKEHPDVLATLTSAFAERGIFFSIEPENTVERWSRPVAWIESMLAA